MSDHKRLAFDVAAVQFSSGLKVNGVSFHAMRNITRFRWIKLMAIFSILWTAGLMDLANASHLYTPLEAKPGSEAVVELQSDSVGAAYDSDGSPCERPCLSEFVSCLSICPAIEPSFHGDPNALLGYQFVRPGGTDLLRGEKPLIDPGPPKTVRV